LAPDRDTWELLEEVGLEMTNDASGELMEAILNALPSMHEVGE
jgi:hypothetical protein